MSHGVSRLARRDISEFAAFHFYESVSDWARCFTSVEGMNAVFRVSMRRFTLGFAAVPALRTYVGGVSLL